MNVIVFPGRCTSDIFDDIGNKSTTIKNIVVRERNCKYFEQYSSILVTKESLVRETDFIEVANYTGILNVVFNDIRTTYISHRNFRKYGIESEFNSSRKIESIAVNAYKMIIQGNVDKVVFQATPHSIFTWVFAKVAEFLGVRVLFTAITDLPWKVQVVEGIDEQKPVELVSHEFDSEEIEAFIQKKKSSTKAAIPIYEIEKELRYKGKSFSISEELKQSVQVGVKHFPFRLLSSFNKYRALSVYNNLVSRGGLNLKKSIVYFMHVQPERTSLPEGGIFGNQYFIIRILSSFCKVNGLDLVIKEHPSSFRTCWDSDFRSKSQYSEMANLSNVKFLPLDMDSRFVIENVLMTATITGSVALESLIRNTPVLCFSPRELMDFKGLYQYSENIDISSIVKLKGNNALSENVMQNLTKIDNRSFKKNFVINTSIEAMKAAIVV
jgi:hypothetical protein